MDISLKIGVFSSVCVFMATTWGLQFQKPEFPREAGEQTVCLYVFLRAFLICNQANKEGGIMKKCAILIVAVFFVVCGWGVLEDVYATNLGSVEPSEGVASGGTFLTMKPETGDFVSGDTTVVFKKADGTIIGQGTEIIPSSIKITCKTPLYNLPSDKSSESVDIEVKIEKFFSDLIYRYIGSYTYKAIPFTEREALIALYNDAGGASWANQTKKWYNSGAPFPRGTECEEWYGVTCDMDENGNYHVAKIELSSNNLDGTIPGSINNLTHLQTLDLYGNNLSGAIPAGLNRSNLSLNLSENTGLVSIPTDLIAEDGITETSIPLSWNPITDPGYLFRYEVYCSSSCDYSVPELIDGKMTTTVTNLRQDTSYTFKVKAVIECGAPDIVGNYSGQVSERTSGIPYSEREALIALYNSADGENWSNDNPDDDGIDWNTPPSYGDNFAMPGTECDWYGVDCAMGENEILHVTKVELPSNNLLGTIPAAIEALEYLETLDLSGNHLGGDEAVESGIPTSMGSLTNLVTLDLSGSELEGSIPSELEDLTALVTLDLSGNQLTDSIPPELGNLVASLKTLDLSDNQLTDHIPPELGDLGSLKTLNLARNKLENKDNTTNIPSELANLKGHLVKLDLSGNNLVGKISNDFELFFDGLNNGDLNLGYNAFYAEDDSLLQILTEESGYEWGIYQTVSPVIEADKPATELNSITLKWMPIPYTDHGGGYNIEYKKAGDDYEPYGDSFPTVENKATGSFKIENLAPCDSYSFRILTSTPKHIPDNPHNDLESDDPNVINVKTLCIPLEEKEALLDFQAMASETSQWDDISEPGSECYGTIIVCENNRVKEINLSEMELSGHIPESLKNPELLKNPGEIGEKVFDSLTRLDLSNNGFTGGIPAWGAGDLPMLEYLGLGNNKLAGVIPNELSNLSNLKYLKVNDNQLELPEDSESREQLTTFLDTLEDDGSNFYKNTFDTDDIDLILMLGLKQEGTVDWRASQTVAPDENSFEVTAECTTAYLEWDPILYTQGNGGYEVWYRLEEDEEWGEFDPLRTDNKEAEAFEAKGLEPETNYCFRIRTVTLPETYSKYTSEQCIFTPICGDCIEEPTINVIAICDEGYESCISSALGAHGPATGVTKVKISGSGFCYDATVKINDIEIEAEKVTVDTARKFIECEIPPYEGSITEKTPVQVVVINPNMEPVVADERFIYDPPPIIDYISPTNESPECGGTDVEVHGKNFGYGGGATVEFGNCGEGENVVVSDTMITCTIPDCKIEMKTQVDVVVTNKDDQEGQISKLFTFTEVPTPVIDEIEILDEGISKGSSDGGNSVKIKGKNFITGATATFGERFAEIIGINTATGYIECITPSHAPGDVPVVVYNPAEINPGEINSACRSSASISFTFADPPTISKIEDTFGYVHERKSITITGEKFEEGAIVKFDDAEAEVKSTTITDASDTITCETPLYKNILIGENVLVKVEVVNPDGQSAYYGGDYTYIPIPKPETSRIEPTTNVPLSGGTFLTIEGSNFIPDESLFSDSTKVSIIGEDGEKVSCSSLKVHDEHNIVFATPVYTQEGSVHVEVTNPDKQASEPYCCLHYKDTKIELTPIEGPKSGGTIVTIRDKSNTITFVEGVTATFGDAAPVTCSVDPDDSSQTTCATPSHPTVGLVNVTVTNGDNDPISPCENCFTFLAIRERDALLKLYEFTDGNNWRYDKGWKEAAEGTECEWHGIECDDQKSHVVAIDLNYNNLDGTIPREIGDFEYLKRLSLRSNHLREDIPKELMDLKSLKQINLCFNDCLETEDADLKAFLKERHDCNWESTQMCSDEHIIVEPVLFEEIHEGGDAAQFKIRLRTKPTSDVTIEMNSSKIGKCDVISLNPVTIGPEDWISADNEASVDVFVKCKDDGIDDKSESETCTIITQGAVSDDPIYDGANPKDVTIIVIDETPGIGIDAIYPTLATDKLSATAKGKFDEDTEISVFAPSGDEIPSESVFVNNEEMTLTLTLTEEGAHTVKVVDENGKEDILPDAFTAAGEAEIAAQRRKRAIIFGGGGRYDGNLLRNIVPYCTSKSYGTLIFLGYENDDTDDDTLDDPVDTIHYLRYRDTEAVIADNDNVDGDATLENLENAITTWAKEGEANELLIYMVGPVENGEFVIDGTKEPKETLTAETLDELIDSWQNDTKGKVIFICDAPMSGNFISKMAPPDGKERYMITSADKRAYFLDDGKFSFSHHLWDGVYRIGELYKAFNFAKDMMTSVGQTSQLNLYNGSLLSSVNFDEDITIGRGRENVSIDPVATIDLPEVGNDSLTCQESETTISTEVADVQNEIGSLFVRVVPSPKFQSESPETPVILVPTMEISDEVTSKDFTNPGEHRVFIHLTDKKGNQAASQAKIVTKQGYEKGDVNGDCVVDLADAILALKIATGKNDVAGNILTVYADVNGDERIGMEEVIYILKKLENNASGSENPPEAKNCKDKGDVNGDDAVDLRDAIAILKIAVGKTPAVNILPACADISGDGMIGVEEAVYVLRSFSDEGLR